MLVDFIKLLKNTPGWSSSKYVQSLSSDNRKTLADRSQEGKAICPASLSDTILNHYILSVMLYRK